MNLQKASLNKAQGNELLDSIKGIRLDNGQFYYLAAFALFTVSRVFERSSLVEILFMGRMTFCHMLLFIAMALLFIKLCLQKYTPIQAYLLLIMGSITALSSMFSHTEELAFLFVFVVSAQDVNIKSLARVSLVSVLLVFAYVVCLSLFGIIENETFIRQDGVVRYSFGFRSPNYFGSTLFQICCALAILFHDNKRFLVIIISLIAVLFNAGFADSRSSIVATLLIAIITIFGDKALSRFGRKTILLSFLIMLAVCFFSIYMMINYDPSIEGLAELNQLTASRLYFGHYFYELMPPQLFGQDLSVLPKTLLFDEEYYSYIIDNSYMRFVIIFGIVPAVVALSLFIGLAIKAFRETPHSFTILVLCVIAIYAFTEKLPLSFDVSYCFILLATLLFNRPISTIDD